MRLHSVRLHSFPYDNFSLPFSLHVYTWPFPSTSSIPLVCRSAETTTSRTAPHQRLPNDLATPQAFALPNHGLKSLHPRVHQRLRRPPHVSRRWFLAPPVVYQASTRTGATPPTNHSTLRHLPSFRPTLHWRMLELTWRNHLKFKRLLLKSPSSPNLSDGETTKLGYVIIRLATISFTIEFISLRSPSYSSGSGLGIRLSTRSYAMMDLEMILDIRSVTCVITSPGFSSARIAQVEVASVVSLV